MLSRGTSNSYGNVYNADSRQQSQNIPYRLLYIAIAFKEHLHIAETSVHEIIDNEVTHQPIQVKANCLDILV